MYVGDADQKAYAAMELQTMALDSRSQVSLSRSLARVRAHSLSLPLVVCLYERPVGSWYRSG
jgi:hypothetical protein